MRPSNLRPPSIPADVAGIATHALRLLRFLKSEVARVGLAAVHQSVRHLPAVLEIELLRDIAELEFEVGEVLRRHRLRIDPAPDGVGVPAAFLLMKDDDTRLTG